METKYITNNTELYRKTAIVSNVPDEYTFFLTQNEILVKGIYNYFYMPSDQLVMIHNKLHEILNVLLIGWMLSGVNWSSNFYTSQIKLLDFMISKIILQGNNAYSLFENFDRILTEYIMAK